MKTRVIAALVGLPLSLLSQSSLSDDEIELTPVRGSVEMRDLANVASELGLRFEVFDYESQIPHCIHFYVDESLDNGPTKRHDGAGHCGIEGRHRLTVAWKLADGMAKFSFRRFNRDLDQGGAQGGPTIEVPNSQGSTLFRVEPPVFRLGDETILVHGTYGWGDKDKVEFKVIAELRPNPDRVVGTE